MVMYRPHWMPPRDRTEEIFWEESLENCTTAVWESGQVWQPEVPPSSGLLMKGPYLGPLLQCVAERLAADNRHHKGLLAFYPQQPAVTDPQQPAVTASLPSRYPPSTRDWKQGLSAPQPAQCQSLGRVLDSPVKVMTSLHCPDTWASCG